MVKIKWFDVAIHVIVITMTALTLYPFLYIVSVSLSSGDQVYGANITIYPKDITFSIYEYIFRLPSVYRGYLNSVVYTGLGTILSVTLTVCCAYPLSKKWLVGRSGFIIYTVITLFIGGGLVPLYIIVKKLGLFDTMWGVLLPSSISTWLVFIGLAYFKSIPVELEEASYIDGANDWKIMTKVYIPLSKPILATLSLYYSVGIWNSWFFANLFLKDTSKYPIQLVLRNMMSGTGIQGNEMTAVFGDIMRRGLINPQSLNYALIVAVILPIIFVYPFLQKYFIKGAMIGSLKG